MPDYPPEFECPFTLCLMKDPVIDDQGMTFDRQPLLTWLSQNGNKHPVLQNTILLPTCLKPNYALKSQISRYLEALSPPTPPTTLIPPPSTKFVQGPLTLSGVYHPTSSTFHLTVTPPTQGSRQPIVLLLALDNSGSMSEAVVEGGGEGSSFSRLDLCKHTVRTLGGMLTPEDSLCLVTFSTTAKVVMEPTRMTPEGKRRLECCLSLVQPDSQTNLYAALEALVRVASREELQGQHLAAALLTDGMPNMDPPRGILPTFADLAKPPLFTLSTFGFGYALDSKLLVDLAVSGGGMFGFIPDYSMVATCFINWAACMMATAATNHRVVVTYQDGTTMVQGTGRVQLGVPLDFLIPAPCPVASVAFVEGGGGEGGGGEVLPLSTSQDPPPPATLARVEVIAAIQACLEAGGVATPPFPNLYEKYSKVGGDPTAQALVSDLKPSSELESMGQVFMAPQYFSKWGKHFLRSYARSQAVCACMNFKDPGLQVWGKGEVFKGLQRLGDDVFSKLPPLEPSRGKQPSMRSSSSTGTFSMGSILGSLGGGGGGGGGGGAVYYSTLAGASGVARGGGGGGGFERGGDRVNMGNIFNNPRGGCWAPGSLVLMGDGVTRSPIETLRRGDQVWTPQGPSEVDFALHLGTHDSAQSMCKVGELWITPWHPVLVVGGGGGGETWTHPATLSPITERMMPCVHNLILSRGHVVNVGGVLSCTLGHGMTGEIIEHPFFGDRDKVVECLKGTAGFGEGLCVFRNLQHVKEEGAITGWFEGSL